MAIRLQDAQEVIGLDISRQRQNAFASPIWIGVRHSASKIAGAPTRTQSAFALEVATFSLFALYKNSIPRGESSLLELVIE